LTRALAFDDHASPSWRARFAGVLADDESSRGELLFVADILQPIRWPLLTNRELYSSQKEKSTMFNTSKLVGAFPLTQVSIKQNVTRKSPGAYVLGALENNSLPVRRSGRSDFDIAARLADHIGKYSHFMYCYSATAAEAFYAECELHHDFNPADNLMHPDRPANTNLKCPRCIVFG
jgi:hypothetical protein